MGVTGSEWPSGVGMAQVGSEWPNCVRYVFDVFFDAKAVRNGYSIFEYQSNTYVALQTKIEHNKHTSLSKPIKLSLSR